MITTPLTTKNKDLSKNGIWAMGNILVDQIKMIDHWPKEETLALTEMPYLSPGGAVNVALDLNKLQADFPVFFGGKIGQDALGDFLIERLSQTTINYSTLLRTDQYATPYTDVMTVKSTGRRTFFHHTGSSDDFGIDDVLNNPLQPAKIVYLAYFSLLKKMDQADEQYGCKGGRLFFELQQRGYQTALDCVSAGGANFFKQQILPALKYVDILLLNDFEATLATDEPTTNKLGDPDRQGLTNAIKILAQYCHKTIVIHFPKGAISYHHGEIHYHNSYVVDPIEIKGSVGAGDAFSAGILYALHEGYHINDAVNLANANARFNLLNISATEGAKPLAEIQAWMKTANKRKDWSCSIN